MIANSNIVAVLIYLFCDFSFGLKYDIPNREKEKREEYWFSLMRNDIEQALNKPIIDNVAKNVIIFVGDGMGITASTAGRIYKEQRKGKSAEEGILVWEKFPNLALIKTYGLDKQVPESAATATAIFGGIKTNFNTLGVNGRVAEGDCQASRDKNTHVTSILEWCQDAGKETGIVTSTRFTHATPAALYAHSANRNWECDQMLKDAKENTEGCKDIARQFVEDVPGRNINVVFAGGRRQMGASLPGDNDDSCKRNDSRNLVDDWIKDKAKRGMSSRYVTNIDELHQTDVKNVDFILGLFADGHFPFTYQRNDTFIGVPSLKELTEVAIKRLQRNEQGFFLMVEGGRIDSALHEMMTQNALEELLSFEEAIEAALRLTNSKDTLIIVTADHSHTLTMNGYPNRGNDILGLTNSAYADENPFFILMYTPSCGANGTYDSDKMFNWNMTGNDTTKSGSKLHSAAEANVTKETHGGEDIAAYAVGPMAHLFHRVHEQPYIAHVMGYAACVGPYKNSCVRPIKSYNEINNIYEVKCPTNSESSRVNPLLLLLLTALYFTGLRIFN